MLVKERVFVLKTVKYSESDLIVHCINKYGSKLNFIAKSALKSRKRFGGGVLEPTHYIEVGYKKKEDIEALHILKEASLVESFPKIRNSYEKIELALHFVDLIAKFCQEGVVDSPELFDLLGNSLKALESSEKLLHLRIHFELKLLHFQGVMPSENGSDSFLNLPIQAHQEVKMDFENLRTLKNQVEVGLLRYINS